MKINLMKKVKSQILMTLAAVLLIFSVLQPGPAYAFGPGRHPVPFYPPLGQGIRVPARALWPVHVGALTYFFLDGIFYRSSGPGYVVTAAPRGAVVPRIPPAAVLVHVGDATYYTHADVCYRKVPHGYLVVTPPAEPARSNQAIAWEGDQIRVNVSALNVRSGPGSSHNVIGCVKNGDILEVQSSSSGWYFVKLPDASSGWVMAKFTNLLKPRALGMNRQDLFYRGRAKYLS